MNEIQAQVMETWRANARQVVIDRDTLALALANQDIYRPGLSYQETASEVLAELKSLGVAVR